MADTEDIEDDAPLAGEAPDDADILDEARKTFQIAQDHENENRTTAKEDLEFARKGDQWPVDVRKQRDTEGRPCLTINKLPAFIRQVVNDARQNKPSIKVHPVDDQGDVETAAIFDGLIRNIEYVSHADIAYDTATEQAVGGGFGYIRVGLDFAHDDSFDRDISINRVANQFAVYGDPNSTAADSSDWNVAHVINRVPKDEFKAKYPKAEMVDWDGADWQKYAGTDWINDDGVLTCEYWTREEVEKTICKLVDNRDGSTTTRDKADIDADEDLKFLIEQGVVEYALDRNGKPIERTTKSWKVTQRILTAVEVLSTRPWPGKYIPIIPVYGDEFFIEGKRYLRSMIHSAIDSQRMFNYWRTTATELVALAPRVPFIGEEGAFDADLSNWQTANVKSHPFLEYTKGKQPPQRQPLDMGVAAGALQEALNASDDMKAIIGLYDASLGAQSNEISGVAIRARQGEGDVSTFHFVDNMARAIRWLGTILIDLIQQIYTEERIVRVIGEDGSAQALPINQQYQAKDPQSGAPMMTNPQGQPVPQPPGAKLVPGGPTNPPYIAGQDGKPIGVPIMAFHDIAAGKYDLTVSSGPGYTTRRAEAAAEQMELIKAFPEAAPVIGDILVKNLDWDNAEEIADRMKALMPQPQQGLPPQVQQLMEAGQQKIQQLSEQVQQLTAKNNQLQADKSAALAKVQQAELDSQRKASTSQQDNAIKLGTAQAQLDIEGYDAETRRIAAMAAAVSAITPPPITNADAPQT
jgi:outer membrane murein-binding lipoprotein Lpp